MIQKVSKTNTISFIEQALSDKQDIAPIKEEPKIAEKAVAPIEKARHLDNKDMISRGSKVMSATSGKITNMGGPKKFMGSQTNNTLWNPDLVEKLGEIPDSKERMIEEKAENERYRKGMKKEQLDKMVDVLQNTDQRKTSTVVGMSTFQGSNYNTPQNNMSIFDKEDFERVPEKTHGEKIAEESRKPKEKDDSWQHPTRKTLKNSIDKFFE